MWQKQMRTGMSLFGQKGHMYFHELHYFQTKATTKGALVCIRMCVEICFHACVSMFHVCVYIFCGPQCDNTYISTVYSFCTYRDGGWEMEDG